MKHTRIGNVSLLSAPKFEENSGALSVHEVFDSVPFEIKRMFTVCGVSGETRGGHAHIACSQYLICVAGAINVTYVDGYASESVLLQDHSKALLVPPGIWLDVFYKMEGSVLVVLCDRIYEPEDYIKIEADFLRYKSEVIT